MDKLAIIHIGQHKTGTTTIQKNLGNNLNKKIYVPENFRYNSTSIINHSPLAWYFYEDERLYNLKNNYIKFTLDKFKTEIKNKKIIFLSGEDFSLLLSNNDCKKKFEEVFFGFRLVYICFLRNTYDKNSSLSIELSKHVKDNIFLRKYNLIKLYFSLSRYGYVKNIIFKNKKVNFYYTDHLKFIKKIVAESFGKFFFFTYSKNTEIVNEFFKMGILQNNNDKKRLNVTKFKIKFFFLILNKLFRVTLLKTNHKRQERKILKLKEIIDSYL